MILKDNFYIIYIIIVIVSILVKILLIKSYRSTDFEVHRNWLAITYSLPIHEWYFDATSPWTLDYPPYFAYFELFVASFAQYIDPNMLNYRNIGYDSIATIYFQRFSVIITDLLLAYGVYKYLSSYTTTISSSTLLTTSRLKVALLIIFNSALLLIDHIHFQYNGMLIGLLVLCFTLSATRQYLPMLIAFSTLLLMKHLFAPLVFVFGIYLLNFYCCYDQEYGIKYSYLNSAKRIISLFIITIIMLMIAFVPMIISASMYSNISGVDMMMQIFTRLFPFDRGLVHAYWAPNLWAIYCFVDKMLSVSMKIIPSLSSYLPLIITNPINSNSSTSGIVGDFHFDVLSSISPSCCLMMIMIISIPALTQLWKRYPVTTSNTRMMNPIILSTKKLIQVTVFVTMTSYMVGYHVHEKAIIIPMICQAILLMHTCDDDHHDSPFDMMNTNSSTILIFLLLSMVGTYSLFPLFINIQELFTKLLIWLSYNTIAYYFYEEQLTGVDAWIYMICGVILLSLFIFAEIFHPATMMIDDHVITTILPATAISPLQQLKRFEFLPLMMTSFTCAVMLMFVWYRTFVQAMSLISSHILPDATSNHSSPLQMQRSLSEEILSQGNNAINEFMKRMTPRTEDGQGSTSNSPRQRNAYPI